jgi:hypothetical protein
VGELQEHDKRVKGVNLPIHTQAPSCHYGILHTLLYDPAFDKAKFFQVTPSEQRMHTVNLYFVPVKLYNVKLQRTPSL